MPSTADDRVPRAPAPSGAQVRPQHPAAEIIDPLSSRETDRHAYLQRFATHEPLNPAA